MDYVIKNVSAQELSQRFTDKFEVYNEEMSPTSVDIGYDHKMNVQVAIKHVHKDQLLSQQQKNQAIIECTAHSLLKHQNLVQLYDCFQTDKEYTLILEYMNQANYFKEKIDEVFKQSKQIKRIQNPYPMKRNLKHTCLIFQRDQIIPTNQVNFFILFQQFYFLSGYIHCDIKLENLFCHKDEETETRIVKIGDFGLVHKYDLETGKGFMVDKCGTASYIAPEITNNSIITPKIDIWSLGIVLYKMGCGYKPTQIQGFKYGQGPIPFRKFDWKNRSPNLQDMIIQMLQMDPQNRPTCEQLLQHKWFDI